MGRLPWHLLPARSTAGDQNGGKFGTKAAAKESLTTHGWSKKLSPLWELLWMRLVLLLLWICLLHNPFLGLRCYHLCCAPFSLSCLRLAPDSFCITQCAEKFHPHRHRFLHACSPLTLNLRNRQHVLPTLFLLVPHIAIL